MSSTSTSILPGALSAQHIPTLGVMGGGQLGRMFVQVAERMGYRTVVLEPDANSPAGEVSSQHIASAYNDAQGLAQLAEQADAITCEFENVPAFALRTLAQSKPVAPAAECVAVAQDRAAEKAHFSRTAAISGVGPAPYAIITNSIQMEAACESPDLFPAILKTARLGYDGKGQLNVPSAEDLPKAWLQLGSVACVLEKRLELLAECSVIVARGRDGAMVHLPVQRNTHHAGILALTEVYSDNIPHYLAQQAEHAARQIAHEMNYVGVLCVEFFVVKGADNKPELVVNEMAPRPHNSGHWSMDASSICQFELQVRALAGLPLIAPRQHSAAVMLNILGESWFAEGEKAQTPDWNAALALPGVHLHLYGKLEPRRGRKMGHITVTAASSQQARSIAAQLAEILHIEGTGLSTS